MTRRYLAATLGVVALAGCGSQRADTEHLMLRWTEALNLHLASSFDEGNHYPWKLVDVDPALRPELAFDDAWGRPLHYRRVTDSQFDLASGGPDGVVGNADDVVIQDRKLRKPETAWAERPVSRELRPQSGRDRPTGASDGVAADAGEPLAEGFEGADFGGDDGGGEE